MNRLPEDVSRELERVVRRWRELSADHALAASGDVRELVQDLAAVTAGQQVPELGPAVLIDQLRVLVWDAASAGVPEVAERLADLRRRLPLSLRRIGLGVARVGHRVVAPAQQHRPAPARTARLAADLGR